MSALSHGSLTVEQRADLRGTPLSDRLTIKGLNRTADLTRFVREVVIDWTAAGKISEYKAGFGFATSGVTSERALVEVDPENPYAYIAAAFTAGDVPEYYKWNAVRKIYELVRLIQEGHDISGTLQAVQDHPQILRPSVPSKNSDGTVPWGPFSWGGAVIRRRGGQAVICAFSVWTQQEDDAVASEAAEWMLGNVVPRS